MPGRLFVFSDMQFDESQNDTTLSSNSGNVNPKTLTNHEALVRKYEQAGYQVPELIYWNLRGNTPDFPATVDTAKVALVSGFNPNLLRLFLDSGGDLRPYNLMRRAIDDKRYRRVQLEPAQPQTKETKETKDDWIVM
jgi:hypothetical protein